MGTTATHVRINEEAPVRAAREVEIAAPPETVWGVLSTIDRWPTWNPEVKAASTSGPLAEGSEFRWKAGPATVTSIVRRLDPPRTIGWTGKSLGTSAIHVWRLEAQNGKTLVRTEESLEGIVARVLRKPLEKTLNRMLEGWLRQLKAEAERRNDAY